MISDEFSPNPGAGAAASVSTCNALAAEAAGTFILVFLIPPLLEGQRVIDLGCGTGMDVYTAPYLAEERDYVVGVDMTDEQLSVGRPASGSPDAGLRL